MKYAVVTFGCRVNLADSLVVARDLRARGAVESPAADADVVVVNTCSVTATADQGARQQIRRIARENPAARIVVTGCYATRCPDELRGLPNVVAVVANGAKDGLVAHAIDWRADRAQDARPASRFAAGDGPCGAPLEPGVAGRTALTLRVQTGCDESCSYCIIPRTRGTGRSRPLDGVLREVDLAIGAGYREIVIVGVHLGSYGRDLPEASTLTTLVRALATVRADVLFRLSSLEPMDCSRELVDVMAASPRIAPHVHLPLQHGSDIVLRAMRRPYTAAAYAALVDGIRARMPHASIGTDLIVGFPGESAGDFQATERLVGDLPLSYLHVFPYSDRPGTEASRLAGKVDGAVIRERGGRLREIGRAHAARFRRSQQGTRRRALTVDDGWSAVTDNYLKVRLDCAHPRNQWVDVVIQEGDA